MYKLSKRTKFLNWLSGIWLFGQFAIGSAFGEDFRHDLSHWRVEAEGPVKVTASGGILDVDSAKGVTLWYNKLLTGPIEIDYDAQAVSEGGVHDTVSDLNAFWMASDGDEASVKKLPHARSGRFADYDDLRAYYIGIGGNRNTTTRLRRYVGRMGDRPILPGNDRHDSAALLKANRWVHIRLIADGRRVEVFGDGVKLGGLVDQSPYSSGYFALRTTVSHIRIRNLKIRPLVG